MTPTRKRLLTSLPVVVLDGPTGTELERRGLATRLPLWTATAPHDGPELLLAVHRDYVLAGADVITASTFRTTRHTLAKAGRADDARALTRDAVQIALEATRAASRAVSVAGSIAPLEDCYFPERTPPDDVLVREHNAHIDALVANDVDLLLVETMSTRREAIIATQAAVATGLPVVVSLLAGPNATMFDGEPMSATLQALAALSIETVAVNCCSVQRCTEAMAALSKSGMPFGAYANAGEPDGTFGFVPRPMAVEGYANAARAWLDAGATWVGACCGTGPAHIARLRALADERYERGALPDSESPRTP